MPYIKQILFKRLEKKGVGVNTIPLIFKDLSHIFSQYPHIDQTQANIHMRSLGWDNLDLDYHTFQLVVACLELDGFHGRRD